MMIEKFEDVDNLSDGDFEIFVKDLLGKHKWKDLRRTMVGIDARHGDGGFDIEGTLSGKKWLFEVKQRGGGYKVGKDALEQIVFAGKERNVKNLALITNQFFTTVVIEKASLLDVELFDRNKLKTLFETKSSEEGIKKPRKYQKEIIDEIDSRVQKGENKFLIQMATGLGKTITVINVVKILIEKISKPNPRILFLAHQKEILKQSRYAFKENLGLSKYSYAVCYDGAQIGDHNFIFATFETTRLQKIEMDKLLFDIIVIDECHHTPAKTFSEVTRMFSPKYLIGLSATPDRMDKLSTSIYFGGEDQMIGKLDLAWALAHGYLAKPKYRLLTDDIDDKKLSEIKMGLALSDIDKKVFIQKKDEEVIRIVEENIEKVGLKNPKGVVFCKSIQHMKNLIQYFPPGTATMIHSNMDQSIVAENISSFRGGHYKYILVRDIFNEGVDIPEINLIIFLRKTSSKTIWLQQLGRGLRKTENKKFVDVFDFVGSVARILEINELNNEIRRKVITAKNNHKDIDREDNNEAEELLELDDNGIIYDDHLDVNFTKTSVEIQKLLEKMSLETKTKEDCLRDLNEISEDLGRLPTYEELIDGLVYSTEVAILTLFDNYLDFLRKKFSEDELLEIKAMIRNVISEFAIENYKHSGIRLSAESVTSNMTGVPQKNLPLCSLRFTEEILDSIKFIENLKDDIISADSEFPEKIEHHANGNLDRKSQILRRYREEGHAFNVDNLTSKEFNEILDEFLSVEEFKKELEKA